MHVEFLLDSLEIKEFIKMKITDLLEMDITTDLLGRRVDVVDCTVFGDFLIKMNGDRGRNLQIISEALQGSLVGDGFFAW